MPYTATLHIEALPEGGFLATSDEIQGLVAQGRTLDEALEIARDVARRLLQARAERDAAPTLQKTSARFDYPLIVDL